MAKLEAAPTLGSAPLPVTFSNLSTPTQIITGAVWHYGDGVTGDTLALTHTHVYTGAGVYTVTLSVGDGVITDTLTRTNYITVTGGTSYTTTTRVITYLYDKLYRLTGADYSTGESFEYGYDAVGNRAVQTRTLTATSVITYHYNDANRLDYFYTDGVPTDLDWDANGALHEQGTSVYTWDAANRLVGAEVGGLVSSFAYNGLGQRMAQAVDGLTTEYVLDVAGGMPEVIVATAGGSSTRYVQVQGQILAQQEAGAWAYVLPDHLGSVRQLVDPDGQVSLAQSYDPFGVLLEVAGPAMSGFAYTGEQEDVGTDLVFLRSRYYASAIGRFISKDPWMGSPLQSQTQNGWSYVRNNPANRVDPSGRVDWDACTVNGATGTCYAEPGDYLYNSSFALFTFGPFGTPKRPEF